jgi:Domain of unknown function (DUF5625)
MRDLKNKHLISYALLFSALVALGLTSCRDGSGIESPPVIKSINLAHEGIVSRFDLKVTEHLVYQFDVMFRFPENNSEERARIRKIIGGYELDKNSNPIDPGLLTPLNLVIYKENENSGLIVYQKSITPVLTSWGGDNFKKIMGHCDLTPGRYTVLLKNLAHPKEYESIPTFFVIGMDKFKTTFDPKNIDRNKTCPQ